MGVAGVFAAFLPMLDAILFLLGLQATRHDHVFVSPEYIGWLTALFLGAMATKLLGW